ncbi:RasGEF domain-containing protein [Cavenderia fasciculata]|uniref:RasGEF domain-containing protein n=1 Tax=Cavenderia fasciculata TaxID=261658 RepID=F4PTA4_CACFS|nr:RasGEF domain-containing protein [Cavenderia fasciculata]EGG20840.1 RasGEF domain-containing protein [Cavenderia fasciculata]|eukprot:XP_004358690.1 RasGEF domain-containing protein [Cavenderia fasciculata]
MEGGGVVSAPSFPFYLPDEESYIVYLTNVNRKDGCSAIKCCTLAKLIEKLSQSINYDNYSVSAFFLTYKDYTRPMEVLQLLASRYAGPPPGSCKDHLRRFEIEIEIVQTKQLIGTLVEKDFEDKPFSNSATEFMNSLPEDVKNEMFLIYYKAKKLTKSPSSQTIVTPPPKPNNISSASSTMRFSYSVSPKTQSPNSTSNVLQGLLSVNSPSNSGGNSPTNSTHLQPSTSLDNPRSSVKLPKGFMSKILPSGSSTNLMSYANTSNPNINVNGSKDNSSNNSSISNSSSNNSSSGGSSSISNSSSASSTNLYNNYHGINGQNIDEDNPYPEKTAFAPEYIARELTVMEFELISALTLNEFSQRQWNKENQAINIQNLITWFNRISSWVSTKIISKETPEERAVIIEAFINIANYAKELKNYNCVMEILGSLHNSSISRLKNSWALISQKANDMFQTLNTTMSPDINFRLYRKNLGAVLPSEPCIPYLGLFLTDYTYLVESNPPMIGADGSMVNVERIYLISARIQEFFQLFTNCSYGFTSMPQIREAILTEKVWEENEIFRLSKIREEQHSIANSVGGVGGGGAGADGKGSGVGGKGGDSSALSGSTVAGSSSGSSLNLASSLAGEKKRKNFVTKYRMSFTGNDPPPSISPTLSERDWKILTTNAKTIKSPAALLAATATTARLHPSSRSTTSSAMPMSGVAAASAARAAPRIAVPTTAQATATATASHPPARHPATQTAPARAHQPPHHPSCSRRSRPCHSTRTSAAPSPSSRAQWTCSVWATTVASSRRSVCRPKRSLSRATRASIMVSLAHSTSPSITCALRISKILPEKGGLSLTTNGKVKKYSFKNQDEVTEAYSIMTKIWKNHFNNVRSPAKSVSASTTPPTPPRSPKVGRGESFSGITDLPTKDEWSAILKGAKTVQFKKGEVIIVEGVEFHKIFQIAKGECTIVKGLVNDSLGSDNTTTSTTSTATTTTTLTTPVTSPMKSISFSSSSSKGLTVLTKLSTGSIFGEMSFLLQGGSPISVIVSSDVLEVYTLEGYFLNIILKSKPLLAPKFYKYLACVLDTRIKQYKQSIL